MRKSRVAAVAVGVVASVLLAGAPAGAQEGEPPELPLTVTPTSGPAGTVVTVSGGDCVAEDETFVEFALLTVDNESPEGPELVLVAREDAVPAEDGSWSGELTVPEGVDPDAVYYVSAVCGVEIGEEEAEGIAWYDYIEFDVTGGQPTTPPPTVDPGVLPPVTPPVAVAPTAAPAVAVVAQPTFTG